MSNLTVDIPEYDGIGVYAIINNRTGKMYIGSSKNVSARLNQHVNSFKNLKCNDKFKKDIGNGDTFSTKILEKLPFGITQFDMFERETYYIEKHNTIDDGYNVAPTTACTKDDLLKSYDMFPKSEKMKKYIMGIIKKRETPIYPKTSTNFIRQSFLIPEERKVDIQAHATRRGFGSLNAYINHLIEEDMKKEL